MEYDNLVSQIFQKRSVKTIIVSFELDHMEPYRCRPTNVLDPILPVELRHGTQVRHLLLINHLHKLTSLQVPHADAFGADEQLHGSIIMDLREEWKCEEHSQGACFTCKGRHYPINRWKVKSWAAAIVCDFTSLTLHHVILILRNLFRLLRNQMSL
jgi:hypothetical protein